MLRRIRIFLAFLCCAFAVFFFLFPRISVADEAHTFVSLGGYQPFSFKKTGDYYFSNGGMNGFAGASFEQAPFIGIVGVDLDSLDFYGTKMHISGESASVGVGLGAPYFNAYVKFSEGNATVRSVSPAGKLMTRHERLRKERYGIESGIGIVNLFVEMGLIAVGEYRIQDATLVGIKIRLQL